MRSVSILGAVMLFVASSANVEAGLGSLIGKAFKTASTKAQKMMGKGTGKTSGKSGRRVVARTGTRAAGKVGRTSAKAAGAEAVNSASNMVISNLGTEGAMIASRLSPESTVKFGEMAVSIAKSPYRKHWLETLGRHGGKCVDWLWQNKRGIAVGVSATAVLRKPADFLESIGEVTETGVEAIGQHVVHPIVETTAREFARPIAHQASLGLASSEPWWWISPMMTCLVAMGIFWWKCCRK